MSEKEIFSYDATYVLELRENVVLIRLNSCLFHQNIFLGSHLGVNSSIILFRNVVLGHHCEKTRCSVLVTPKSRVAVFFENALCC